MTEAPRMFRGIGASPGVAIGRVFLLDRNEVRVRRYHIQADQVAYEVKRLQSAVKRSIEQLEEIRARFVGGGIDHHTILEAHEMMLRDEAMASEASHLIEQDLINAEWAVSRVIARLRGLFDNVSDAYMRERRGDIDFVGERILRNLAGQVAEIADLEHLQEGTIVVARDLSPVDTALLSRHRITGFVTEVGGKTSHTSIVARSLEVPAVVGVPGLFEAAGSDDLILVDGLEGAVLLRPTRAQLDVGRARSAHFNRLSLDLLEARALPAETVDGHHVGIAGNIELPAEVATVLDRGGEAIGLYRTEFMFIGRTDLPDEEDHYRNYCRIFDEVGDRPVTIRTLDVGGDKVFGPVRHEPEPNPALGMRAIRYCLHNPEVFEAQLAGLLRAATRGNLKIMLPMVSDVGELRAAKQILGEVQQRLADEGKEHATDVPVGIMLEVPSAVMCARELAQESDFFSVGTNDLLQYLLAIDRTNERVNYLYHPLHPAVLRTLKMVTDAASEANIPVSVCGEMAGEPEHAPILVGLGFDQLSMNAGSIPRIKRLIRELDAQACRALLTDVLQCATAAEVEEMVDRFLSAKDSFGLDMESESYS